MIDKSKHEKEFPIQIRNKNGNLIHTENIKGSYLSFEYDHSNRIIGCERSDGFWFKLEYDEKDEIIHFENSNKIWKKFQYNKFGDIKKYEDSYGSNVTFLYDDESRLHCEVGKVVVYINSWQFGYLKEWKYDEKHKEAFTDLWDVFECVKRFDLLQHSDELRYIEFYYNKKGQRNKSVREDGSIEKYEYNSIGNLTSIIGLEGITKKFNFKYTQDGKFLEYSDGHEKIEVEYFNNKCIRKKYENALDENALVGECEEQKYSNDGLPLSHTKRSIDGEQLEIERHYYETINNKIYHRGYCWEKFETNYVYDDKGRFISSRDSYGYTEVEYDDKNKIAKIHDCYGEGDYADVYFKKKFDEIPDLISPEPPKEFRFQIGIIDWDSEYWKNIVTQNENGFEFDYLPISNYIIISEPEIILK